LAAAPETPTVAETGLAGFEAEAWWALFGPRGLPEALVGPLERAAGEAVHDPVVAARLRDLGAEPVGSTGGELAATLQADDAKWGEAARAAGVTVE
jgi:tripartite-type tricarboxylate transporter receptor subunit TctC